MRNQDVLHVIDHIRRHVNGDTALAVLSRRAGWSRFHLHREFLRAAGETPKQWVQRLRLEQAAARLLASNEPVSRIALRCGFSSHEVFTRAFRRMFGRVPARYRTLNRKRPWGDARPERIALAASIGPCVRLFRLPLHHRLRKPAMPTLSIAREERAAQPLLFIRRRIAHSELQGMLAECFGKLYAHGHKAGLPIGGWPLARYVSTGPGLWTVEAAMPLLESIPGEGELEAGSLPAGPVALGLHAGPYEQLSDTHAAMEKWIEAKGYRVGGPPWEWYVTDPAEHPDPADWRTEVYWPLAE
jgi:AraC-like DNA-binding protein/effector-binding domain-containing protein